MVRRKENTGLFVTGIAHEYPPHYMDSNDFITIIKTLYPDYHTIPGLRKLIQFTPTTRINARRTVLNYRDWTHQDAEPPTLTQLSRTFRTAGVDLASSACRKAMNEASITSGDITHIVAVTCTDQGNPGYDLLVCKKLGLNSNVQRTLLSGVGCAGGLSALRAAADIAACESQRGRPARVLVVSCELCSLFLRAELRSACKDDALHIAPALFGDAAAAVVVCNELAMGSQKSIYELQDWGSMVVPDTSEFMSYDIEANGMLATITKEVAKTAVNAIAPMFERLRTNSKATSSGENVSHLSFADFDWAIHPGGAAILQGAQKNLQLSNDHIRASLDVYSSYGNTSSSSVLIVLDKMRHMGKGRNEVIATSFGPGIMIEMFRMRRSREGDRIDRTTSIWARIYRRLMMLRSQRVTTEKKISNLPGMSRIDSIHT